MIRSLIIVVAILFSYAGNAQTDPNHSSDSQRYVRKLYAVHCAMCHGANGEGYVSDNANALANQDFLASVSDEFLRSAIALGRIRTPMAAHESRYGGPLSTVDIDALVKLIRSWQTAPSVSLASDAVTGDIDAGRIIYDKYCISCHGDKGQGTTAVSINSPEFLADVPDAMIRYAIARGRRDTPMPAFEQVISDEGMDGLVTLIRSWQTPVPERQEVEQLSAPDEDIIINPKGKHPTFTLRQGRYVSADQVNAALGSGNRLIILDSRPTSDWHVSHITGAVSAPHYDPDWIIEWLPTDGTWIVTYCACPHTYSDALADKLRAAGFSNTVVLDEGYRWWRDFDYPIE